jgi:hypothetical protein
LRISKLCVAAASRSVRLPRLRIASDHIHPYRDWLR